MASADGFPASFYGEPGVLGLLANGISAFLVLLQNFNGAHTGNLAHGVENILAGTHCFPNKSCGLCQLIAGLLSFRKYDHLSGTSFIGYAALWGSYGATRIYLGASEAPSNITTGQHELNSTLSQEWDFPLISTSAIAGLIPYIFLSFILAFCSSTVNYIMPFVFGAITATLIFEAVGLVGSWALVVSGVLELLILLFAVYGSTALLIKGIAQRYVLKGFGSPLFNVLLLGTANANSSQSLGQEKKKNTKYAEPMALGYFCDTISPFIFAFFCFRYLGSFAVGVAWVSIISAAQLLSSYYAYLRHDCYHITKFGLHCTYWLVKAWEEYVLSVQMNRMVTTGTREAMVGDWFFVAIAIALCVVSLNMDTLELVHNIFFLLLTVSTISQIPLNGYYIFFGVTCSLFTAISLYGTFARLINTIAEKSLIPVGPQPISTENVQMALTILKKGRDSDQLQSIPHDLSAHLPDALFYIVNGLAALSAIHSNQEDLSFLHLTIPWVLISGAIIQVYVSRLQVQGGKRFGSVIPSFYAAVWATWTWYRFAGHLLGISSTSASGFTAGAVAFLVANAFLVLIVAMLAIFSIICLYGALTSMVNCVFSKRLMPLGPPVLRNKKKKEMAAPLPCLVADSRLTNGLITISKLLDQGGVCGIPTDTVYALAASCKNPKAIEKIYNIKDRPAEKPICICISNVEQLVAAKPPFSPLLWEFMRNVYPGGISCIVPKGDWLLKLGIGPAYDRIGTKDSIMIRVPDHTVTGHLCDITGPLAITSANPSGEPDSTHHDMVISRLGHKIQGVLCDGVSNEVVASTVVNCMKIDEGKNLPSFTAVLFH
ncbi:hypothetical protein Z043_110487 [Scleropages formosus]|uniref:Threonylcarbamoyl-AMP synthase n=1 Tax=Scleropages formosus TaxID=113540 RepID=A0A0P7ULT0_SCLFO|nr:hypothetical protein Z043_110487 [Scleropages formosus]